MSLVDKIFRSDRIADHNLLQANFLALSEHKIKQNFKAIRRLSRLEDNIA